MSQPHKHRDAIIAWANGAQIQFFDVDEWIDCHEDGPRWHKEKQYRVKPKIVKREGWIALFGVGNDGLPHCCGIYATKKNCQEVNGPAAKVVRIEWEEEV